MVILNLKNVAVRWNAMCRMWQKKHKVGLNRLSKHIILNPTHAIATLAPTTNNKVSSLRDALIKNREHSQRANTQNKITTRAAKIVVPLRHPQRRSFHVAGVSKNYPKWTRKTVATNPLITYVTNINCKFTDNHLITQNQSFKKISLMQINTSSIIWQKIQYLTYFMSKTRGKSTQTYPETLLVDRVAQLCSKLLKSKTATHYGRNLQFYRRNLL